MTGRNNRYSPDYNLHYLGYSIVSFTLAGEKTCSFETSEDYLTYATILAGIVTEVAEPIESSPTLKATKLSPTDSKGGDDMASTLTKAGTQKPI